MNKMILFAIALIAQYSYGQMGVNNESAAAPAPKAGGFTAGHKKEKRTTPPPAKNGGKVLSPVQETRAHSPHGKQLQFVQQNAAAGAQGFTNPYVVHVVGDQDESRQPCPIPLDIPNHKTYVEEVPKNTALTGGAAAAVQLRPHEPVLIVDTEESRNTLQIPPTGAVASPSQQSSLRFANDFVHGSGVNNDNHSHNPASNAPPRGSIASRKRSSMVSVPSAAANSQIKRDEEYQQQVADVYQKGQLDRAIRAAKRRYVNKIKQNNPPRDIANMANKKLATRGKENTTLTQEVENVYKDVFFLEYEAIIGNYKKSIPDYVQELETSKEQVWQEILEAAHRGCCVIL